MNFLAPLVFLGLAALAVPILVHLTQRERKSVVEFPSLMFLKKIPYESVQRRRIRDWLLLALRAAALALIVLAFTRPFVRGSELVAAGGGAREVVILLDRSYSMSAGDTWARAQAAANQAVGRLGPSDRVSLVLFANDAELVMRSSADPTRVQAEVNAAQPGAGSTRYAPAIKLAASVLAESQLPQREAVLVSDFQRAGWQPDDTLRLPGGAVLTAAPVEHGPAVNLSVTPISLQRAPFEKIERVTITAGLTNRGAAPATNVSVQLEIDGRVVQTQPVTVAPGASASTTFQPVGLTAANTRGVVRIPDDGMARDNAFYFTMSPPEPVRVMVVQPPGSGQGNLYLTRALAIGESPRFEATTHGVDGLTSESLSRTRVVILDDVAVADQTAARLQTFLAGGGGVLMAIGPRASWTPTRGDWLPVAVTATVDRTRGTPAKLSAIDFGHAVFEPFRAPRSGDFASARFYSYRAVTPTAGSTIVARFDAGEPALVERPVGRGRVAAWMSTLDLAWNDFPLKPVYLPFVHQMVRRLANYNEPPLWLTVGQVLDLGSATNARRADASASASQPSATAAQPSGAAAGSEGSAGAKAPALLPSGSGPDQIVLTPAGQRVTISAAQPALALAEQGFYEVRRQARDAAPAMVVAGNVDLTESDVTPLDPAELVAAVSGQPGTNGPAGGPDVIPDEVQEQAQRLWWYLLFAGILLLIAETVLAQRLSRARTT